MSESEPILGKTTKLGSAEQFVADYGYTALRFYLLSIAREILPNERIKVCWRYPLPGRTCIEIIYSEELKRARSSGTMKCGSAWVCPACMMYIQERRRQELTKAMEKSKDKYFTVLATYTASHSLKMPLSDLLAKMQASFRSVKTGRMWQLIKEDYMLAGSVKATEITFGASGWHPHYHELIFVDRNMLNKRFSVSPEQFAEGLQNQIGQRWIEMLAKNGMSGKKGVAFDVRASNKDIAEYIAKWGRAPRNIALNVNPDEVAYSVSKKARGDNLSVLDILYLAEKSSQHKYLFKEYHLATKGKSQLQWSRGLKELLDIEIIRDEIAAEGVETETDVLLAEIETGLWKYISQNFLMGQVMTYANTGDKTKLENLLMVIKDTYQDDWQPNAVIDWDLGH